MQVGIPAERVEQRLDVIVCDQRQVDGPTVKLRQLCLLDDLVLHSVDEALADLFGVATRNAIYQRIELTHKVPKSKIPVHLDDLFQLLQSIFGKGTWVIGRAIAKRLFHNLDWQFIDIPQLGFFEYLDMVRARLTRETVTLSA